MTIDLVSALQYSKDAYKELIEELKNKGLKIKFKTNQINLTKYLTEIYRELRNILGQTRRTNGYEEIIFTRDALAHLNYLAKIDFIISLDNNDEKILSIKISTLSGEQINDGEISERNLLKINLTKGLKIIENKIEDDIEKVKRLVA